ncbi:putative carbohydrate-active enzyme [Clostridium sp. CAG:127]|nr:putative carbohydrate-active enzyme [Clostridium sp. CAG:127]
MRRGKRIVAVFLSVCFAINISISGLDIRAEEMTGITATATDAENEQQDTTYLNTDDIEIESQDSVGEMLAEDLESVYAEQEENSGYNIFNIDVKDRTATVQYEALENATLVVSAYDETTNQMVASASKSVNKDETAVDLELGDLPQYYILKGFIVDSETLQPLTKEFKSELYTQGMQEFLQKTTDDFSEDRVLNFDDDKSNNFAVYNQNTIVIEQEATKNQLISADAEKNIYVFENVDTNMLSLQKDDVLSYEKEDGMVLIVKVNTIDVEGTTVTISGQNADTEDVFDYVKIDSEAGMENVAIDNSNLEDGVEYTGMIEDSGDVPKTYSENANDSQTDALVANESEVGASNGEGSNKLSAEFKLENPKNKDDEGISASVSGKVNIELKNSTKLYIAQDHQYVEVKFDYSLGLNISIKMEVDAKIPLGKFSFAPIPGLKIGLTPNVVLKVSGKLSLEGKLKGCIGVRISAQEGVTNLTSNPKWSGNIKFEATLFIGISLKPEIDLINEKVVELSFEGEVGAEIKSTQEVISSSKSVRHECKSCLDGEISGKESATFKAKFLNLKGATFARTFEINQKLTDFYYSFDYDEFAFTECPHKTYAVTVLALDKEKNPIKDAVISCNSTKYQTDENGKAKFYIAAGTYTISAAKQGVGSYSKILRVYDESKTIEIQIKENNSGSSEEKKGIKIDENTFPDENFRAYINKKIDKNFDGYLSKTEIERTTSINCAGQSISSLKGIEYFVDIQKLNCDNNKLTQLDLSKNTKLESLDCAVNKLTKLNVSQNVQLGDLGCGFNELTRLDVSKNTRLEILVCYCNKLTQLDISKNTELKKLLCEVNDLTKLDISNNMGLVYLSCDYNKQTQLDVSKNTELSFLSCGNNELTQLDVSKNTELRYLSCIGSNLTQLNVGNNTKLETLSCNNNNLTRLDVNNNTKLRELYCESNALTQLELAENIELEKLCCSDNNLTQLDVSNNTCLRYLSCDRNVQVTGYNGTITYPDSSTSENRLDEESLPITDDFSDFEMKEVYKTDNPISAKTVQQVTKADDTHVSYIGLYPNTSYNLYVCKQASISTPFTDVFTEDNLLYINQYESDSDGNLSIDYVPMQEVAGAVEILVAEKRINITDDARVCMADIKYDGETHSPLIEYYFSDSLLSEGIDYEIEGDYEAKEPGTYTIRIRGIGQYTGTLELQYKIIDTTPVVTKPTPVKDLKAVPVSKNEVKLTWTATEKDVKYLIYTKKHGKYEYCGTTSSTSYTDTEALCDDFGYYWVYPCRTDENGEDIIGDCPQYVCAKGVYEEITEEKTANVTISYRTHVQSFGWQNPVTNGVMSGTSGKAKRLEGIEISVSGNKNLGIQYATHCQTYGWLPWSANGEMSGTTGEAKRLEAIKIQLAGADKDKYDVYYRVHAQSYGWLGWAKNGEPSGTAGYAKRLEGIQIVVVKKNEKAPGLNYAGVDASKGVHDSRAYIAKTNGTITIPGSADSTNIMYKTHVQSFGWQNWVLNGAMSGTSGKAKRLEGINIKLSNAAYAGGIQYQTHIQKNGWEQKWKKDGEMSGTSGEAKRLEAIRIKLYGEMANHFDVYYRVHAQSYGWLGWAKNGEESGTAGYAKRLEGIQIVLVPKGSAAPANNYKNIQSVNTKAYIKK